MKKDEQETSKHNIIQQILSSPSQQQPQSKRQSKKITQGLKTLYKAKLKSIESKYELYNVGLLPTNGEILDAEFDAKPMVCFFSFFFRLDFFFRNLALVHVCVCVFAILCFYSFFRLSLFHFHGLS